MCTGQVPSTWFWLVGLQESRRAGQTSSKQHTTVVLLWSELRKHDGQRQHVVGLAVKGLIYQRSMYSQEFGARNPEYDRWESNKTGLVPGRTPEKILFRHLAIFPWHHFCYVKKKRAHQWKDVTIKVQHKKKGCPIAITIGPSLS